MIITIDGPTASGKSTVARLLAQKLGIYFFSTGALYRAIAYILTSIDHYDEQGLKTISAQELKKYINHQNLVYTYTAQQGEHVIYKNTDLTPYLKTESMDYYSSFVATNPNVRAELVTYQRELADNQDLVVEGRDTGSVVFPHAEIKIFLTAALHERARRWQKYQESKGSLFSLDESIEKVAEKDKRDQERAISPLVVPEGATVIDDTQLTKEETLQKILELVQKYRARSSQQN